MGIKRERVIITRKAQQSIKEIYEFKTYIAAGFDDVPLFARQKIMQQFHQGGLSNYLHELSWINK
jgi:hypothetical protein